MKDLGNNGLKIGGKLYKVIFRKLLCDAPAKSFVLGCKGHTGYASCRYMYFGEIY